MNFNLNGKNTNYHGDPERSLLHYLREEAGITTVKDGCSPQAACGACVVQLNDRAVLSCVVPMKKVAGGSVVTTDGLSDFRKELWANSFAEKGAVQCGFCIPGIVMAADALVQNNPEPNRADVQKALTHHLCRCTGYKKIEDAILYGAAKLRQNDSLTKTSTDGRLGDRLPKYQAHELALGKRPFVADIMIDGMLYGAVKLSDHPRARVLEIDTSEAQAVPGVVRTFTAADIPGERYSGLIVQDWPLKIAVGEQTRYVGDVLAGVVAETEAIARAAVEKIKVTYDVLEPVTDPHDAAKAETHQIHPNGNLLSETIIKRGDVKTAKKDSAYVTSGTYKTQMIEHGFMEPECCVAEIEKNGIRIYSQGQGVYEDRHQIAAILGLTEENVNVIQIPNGGAFGGKEDLSIQGHTALFAHLLKKPVKITLNRDESIRMHPKRHPIEMAYIMGCDTDGRLTFLIADIIGDTGAYASVGMKVLERAAGHATGAYHVPNVAIESRAYYTNNIPCGAMRGFGVNQVTFAVESCIDELCAQGNFDRWQFRYDNAITNGGKTSTGQIIRAGSGVRDTLLAVKEAFETAQYAGIACGIKNTGIGNGMPDEGKAKIEIKSPNQIIIHHGWTEMGQGVHTMAVQFLCEETGLPPDIISVQVETSAEAPAGMTTASRATSIVGNAIVDAAAKLKKDLQSKSLADLTGKVYEGEWICDWTTKPNGDNSEIITHYSYSYAAQVVALDDNGEVSKVYAAHDAGRIINPTLFEGQIEGSVHMGLGYALTENFEMQKAVPVSTRLRKCGILRARQTPDIDVIGVEVPDPNGPYGAKGVGEIGLVPTAGAVANALYQYDGIRRYELPLSRGHKKTK